MKKRQRNFFYPLGILLGILFLWLNYYKIYNFSASAKFFIFIFSAVVFLLVGAYLWWHDSENHNFKYQFLTVATHKFRTPLTSMKWMVDELKGEISREQKINLLKQIEISINKLVNIVDILTGLAKSEEDLEYTFEVAWIREMIDQTIAKYSPIIKEKNIIFDIRTDHHVPLVIVDKRRMQFVFDALFENAIKYSPIGGKIEVSIIKQGNFLRLGIRDSGIGINTVDIGRMFTKFFRSEKAKVVNTDGMGLSLALVSNVIKIHGGKIWVESDGEGRGATFFLKLKITEKKPS